MSIIILSCGLTSPGWLTPLDSLDAKRHLSGQLEDGHNLCCLMGSRQGDGRRALDNFGRNSTAFGSAGVNETDEQGLGE